MKKLLFILIASALATASMAQTMSAQEEREFYQKAYAVINDYAQSAAVYSESKKDQFRSLFESGSMEIYNDLMSLIYSPTLTVDNYIKILGQARTVKVTIKNVRKKDQIFYDEGSYTWLLPISFEKSISFVNSCDILFDSHEYFGRDYKLEAVLSLHSDGNCYIRSLTAENANMQFPEEYEVLEKSDDRDNKLTINGSIINFNSYDQVLLHSNDQIKYLGANVEKRVTSDGCNGKVIHARYNDQQFRFRPNVGFALGGFNNLSGADDVNVSTNSEMSFGVDIGYVFPSTGRLQVGVFAGVGLSSNKLTMERIATDKNGDDGPSMDVSIPNAEDIDGDSFEKHYDIKGGIVQEMEASDIAIPLYVDLEYRFAPTVSAYVDLGMKLQTSTGKVTGSISNYEIWGKYNKYDGLEIHNIEELGFSTVNGTQSIVIGEEGVTKSMAINALVGLGLRFNVGKSFAIDAGVQYQTGTKSWKSNPKDAQVAYYTANGDVFSNFVRNSDGINHSALRFTAGVILKF